MPAACRPAARRSQGRHAETARAEGRKDGDKSRAPQPKEALKAYICSLFCICTGRFCTPFSPKDKIFHIEGKHSALSNLYQIKTFPIIRRRIP